MEITWEQVHAWRLARQFVEPRGKVGAEDIISRLCGVQAQVASSAELAVRIRQAKPTAGEVARGLADGTLVKTWAMRGTLHLLPVAEAANYLSLAAAARTWEKPVWQREFGATPAQIQALVELLPTFLAKKALTREELMTQIVADKQFATMADQLRSGWGAVLKPLAWQGALCHGPNQGNKITFTSPPWTTIPAPEEAAPRAIAAYLGAYGPATPETFDAWLTRGVMKKSTLRTWFASMSDSLTKVNVDGQETYILTEHAESLAKTKPAKSVRLLGAFDQYILGPGTKDHTILPPEHRAKVSKAAGWISPILVVNGKINGTWDFDDNQVTLTLFPGAAKPAAKALDAELAHLSRAAGRDLTLRLTS